MEPTLRRPLSPLLGLAALLLLACGGDGGSDAGVDPGDLGAGGEFDEAYAVISTNCTFSGCHSGSSPAAGQNLETQADAFAALVGVDAMGPACGGTGSRAVAGDPGASILISKIEDETPSCGSRMPLGRDPLSEADQAVIRAWVAAGALP